MSLAERIAEVRAAVESQRVVSFGWLAEGCLTRADLIVTFLAVLELFRSQRIRLRQDDLFGEIWLEAEEAEGDVPAEKPAGNNA